MFVRLLRLPEAVRQRCDVSSLKVVVHGAAPTAPEVKRRMIDWFGPVLLEHYGSTELGAVVYCNSADWLSHPGTVGKALRTSTESIRRAAKRTPERHTRRDLRALQAVPGLRLSERSGETRGDGIQRAVDGGRHRFTSTTMGSSICRTARTTW
jgi:acyl-coenzyme A synthetase/AMP-(fatty) acid ligase